MTALTSKLVQGQLHIPKNLINPKKFEWNKKGKWGEKIQEDCI